MQKLTPKEQQERLIGLVKEQKLADYKQAGCVAIIAVLSIIVMVFSN